MSSTNLKLFVCVPALVLATWGCGGSSPPASNTPASSGSELSEGERAPSQQVGNEPSTQQGDASQTGNGAGAAGEAPVVGSPSPTIAGGTGNNTERAAPTDNEKTAAASPLNDEQIAEITDNVNSAEIEQAKLAQSKSKDPHVKSFAAMMIEHHGQARRDQAKLKLSEADSPLSRQLKEESQAKLGELKLKSGRAFDLAYLDAQVEGHQKALDAITQDLLPNAKDEKLVVYLQKLKPRVEEHLSQARAARDAVQASTSNPSGSPKQRATNRP